MVSVTRTASFVQQHVKQGKSCRYKVYLASNEAEVLRAQRLRFLVFNLELNEGLGTAFDDGYDRDPFDAVCDHLLVEDSITGEVIGTYRLQTGRTAAGALGYYSEQEFDFAPFEEIRAEVLELGRACVHRDHRSFEVLNLLWKGIAQYAMSTGTRYLIGCSSLTSQDPLEGWQVYKRIARNLCEDEFRTTPKPNFTLEDPGVSDELGPPKLLRAYLAIGAKICGPPAIDREFKTIDFLTMLDLYALPAGIRSRYLNTR
jgi:putative hemolysin